MPHDDNLSKVHSFLESINETIALYYSDPKFNFDMLAEIMGIAKERLQRKLMTMNADPAATLIRNTRLNKAIELINEGQLNATQVAYRVGYPSYNSFLQAFKKRFDATPYEMMKQRANYGKINLNLLPHR